MSTLVGKSQVGLGWRGDKAPIGAAVKAARIGLGKAPRRWLDIVVTWRKPPASKAGERQRRHDEKAVRAMRKRLAARQRRINRGFKTGEWT